MTPSNKTDWWQHASLGALLFLGVTLAAPLVVPADQTGYLAADPAHYLYSASEVLNGRLPYRDFFWHYGPLPLYSFAGFGRLFGVSPMTLQVHQALWNLLAAALCLRLLTRSLGISRGVLVFLLTNLGWLREGTMMYIPIERVVLFVIALHWRPTWERTWPSAFLVGVLLGLLQGVRFGTAIMAGGAWLLADLLGLWTSRAAAQAVRRWGLWCLVALTGFLAVQGSWIALAFAFLEKGPALIFLWPVFHLQWYATSVTGDNQWFRILNWGYFWGAQFPLLVCAVCAILGVGRLVRRNTVNATGGTSTAGDESLPQLGLLYLPLCYGLQSLFLFKHVYNWISAQWMLSSALGVSFTRRLRVSQAVVVVSMIPCATLPVVGLVRAGRTMRASPASLLRTTMPNGQSLWLPADMQQSVQEIAQVIQCPPRQDLLAKPAVFLRRAGMSIGSGYHFFLKVPSAAWQTWLFPGAIPPWEMEAESQHYRNAAFIAVLGTPQDTTDLNRAWAEMAMGRWLPFDVEHSRRIMENFRLPVATPSGWLVFWRRDPSGSAKGEGPL